MLPVLLNVPRTREEWNVFSFHHRSSHLLIRQAILSKHGVNLSDYVIDPFTFNQPQQWLETNQQLHKDMNGVIGTQSSDLEDVNLSDAKQLEAWVWLHFLEHQTAENTLQVGS